MRKRVWIRPGLLVGVLLMLATALTGVYAQDNHIHLSIALPEFMRDTLGDNAFSEFEAEHPDVKVHVNYIGFDLLFPPSPAEDIAGHLETAEKLASSADVLLFDGRLMTPAVTRAGYFLDLTPLTSADTTLNVDDFIPAAWQSFQWDGGVWALPLSVDVITLIYNPAAFDEAGLAYPNERWTLEDFANAATTLAERDADGKVTKAGLVTFENTGLFLRALLGQGIYDSSVTPSTPLFNNSALEALISKWAELEAEGVVSSSFSGDIGESQPMSVLGTFALSPFPGANTIPPKATLLPGNTSALTAQGVGVSSGTQYPELAYELAKYLTTAPKFTSGLFGGTPARYSLKGVQPESPDDSGGAVIVIGGGNVSPENQAFVDQALAVGLPLAEQRFFEYVEKALRRMQADKLDVRTALQDMDAQAAADLQVADEKRASLQLVVTPPPPEVALAPGEISLKFGLLSFINPLPNREQWEQIISDFTEGDAQVGRIELDTGFSGLDQLAERDDCFYLPYNAVPQLQDNSVLNLDPFTDADPQFDRNDFAGNTLSLVERDNKLWALPLIVQPRILRFQHQLFEQAGVSAPDSGWTFDAFIDTLQRLKAQDAGTKVFEPRDPNGTYLLMLIAAAGGLPFDFRTDPPKVNFTDSAVVEAIRQVLDLAKQDYISYEELAKTDFIFLVGGEAEPAIYSEGLGGGFSVVIEAGENPYHMALYPSGNQWTPISYDIGSAYISAISPNAEACYRWITTLAQHPELFSAMPARRSLLNDPAFVTSQGEDAISVYQQMDALLQSPNAVVFPTTFGSGSSPGNFILQFWLNRAFDHYVLKDADLEAELQEAQTYASAFLECVAGLPSVDPTAQDQGDFFGGYGDCATKVDPSVGALFSSPGG